MLAELAAANAAFAIIKQCVQNGSDIAKAGKAIGDFVSAKDELTRSGNKKRARGVGGNDLEEFMALEQITSFGWGCKCLGLVYFLLKRFR